MKGIAKVANMTSPATRREVANQFIIRTDNATIFQSYNSIIAMRTQGKTYLDKDAWDYSVTTGKYRNDFLGENKRETQRKIDAGIYELVDLNS